MRIFEIVKENVNLREVAELYGIDVNRYGKALCPFHNDRHPSLYVADDHYYCFACGEHGDVIDFVGRLFQLSPYDAARKLMADFHLSPDKPPSAAALHAKRIRTEAQQLMENERLCFSALSDYARVLRGWKVRYAPQSSNEPVHARFVEACHKLDETEYYLDILCAGDSHERTEVIQQQMADGKLDITFHSKEEQMAFYKATDMSVWVADPKGIHTGGWGLTLSPMDMAKIGELIRNGGIYDGTRIVSEEWVHESTSEQSRWAEQNLPYGYLWWILAQEHGCAAMGDGGNIIYVSQDKNMVVAIASHFQPRAKDRIEFIKDHVEPIFD